MSSTTSPSFIPVIIEKDDFDSLFGTLTKAGYKLYGPTRRGNAIVLDRITAAADLPIGWNDRQDSGLYRLEENKKPTFFNYVVGPQSWKKYLHPAVSVPVEAARKSDRFVIKTADGKPEKRAFIGVRPCELQAIAIHDKILRDGPFPDDGYVQRRDHTFIVAVNCVSTGGTCFCTSMGTGPAASRGYDLVLTELALTTDHYFVALAGSEAGQKILDSVPHGATDQARLQAAEKALEKAAFRMGRKLLTNNLSETLERNFDHGHWEKVAERCLSCGNCTSVCPTCFCTNYQEETSLTGDTARRVRLWDSCFSMDFSYIHGGSIRQSGASRYRQWLMHKLAYWPKQFGAFGCVGCGRCITWCPVGIDITEEARTIQESA